MLDRRNRDLARPSTKHSIRLPSKLRFLVSKKSPQQIVSKATSSLPKRQQVKTAFAKVHLGSSKKRSTVIPILTLPDQYQNPAFHCLTLTTIKSSAYLLINAFLQTLLLSQSAYRIKKRRSRRHLVGRGQKCLYARPAEDGWK